MILSSAAHTASFDISYRRVASHASLPPRASDARGLPFDVIWSISLAAHAKWTRKTSWRHRTPAALDAFEAAYTAGSSIVEMASAPGVNTSPFLLARALVERLLRVPRSAVGALVRSPAALIPDARLAAEVAAAAEADAHCSPFVDRVRGWAGEEGEWRLLAGLRARGVTLFITEEALRAAGAARTPDALLRWPIVIACPHGHMPGGIGPHAHAVAWVDSKALFFDAHAWSDAEPQLRAYDSLFGAGVVIAWGGFVADLCACARPTATDAESSGDDCVVGDIATLPVVPTSGPLLLSALPHAWRWATRDEAVQSRASAVRGAELFTGPPPLQKDASGGGNLGGLRGAGPKSAGSHGGVDDGGDGAEDVLSYDGAAENSAMRADGVDEDEVEATHVPAQDEPLLFTDPPAAAGGGALVAGSFRRAGLGATGPARRNPSARESIFARRLEWLAAQRVR